MPLISLITPTGARPKAFSLCEHWVARMTAYPLFQDFEWIVVDDGDPPTLITSKLVTKVIRPRDKWKIGQNTQGRNLLLGVEASSGDLISIVEDDDHYGPDYLVKMLEKLDEGYDIVGEGRGLYYNFLGQRWHRHTNGKHAGLCQTIFRRELIPTLKYGIESGNRYFDMELWKGLPAGTKQFLFPIAQLVIGMKGMPGRAGIGVGHRPHGSWIRDPGHKMLTKWIGAEDVDLYRKVLGGI